MRFDGIIFDLDGTVYRGDRIVPGAPAAVEQARAAGSNVLFLSNNPTKRPPEYADRLTEFGIPTDDEDVLNSAAITAEWLEANHPDRPALVVGEQPLVAELEDAGITVTRDPRRTEIVVVSMDRSFDYETLQLALEAVDDETLFVATNPDRTCPVEDGEIPDAAGMIGAIEGVTGRSLDRVLGKPSSTAVEIATTRMGCTPERCLLVGDRLETDIEMGVRSGMTTALVLTGASDETDLASAPYEPNYVFDSIVDLPELLSVGG
ncbi:HAD-IIA family hydrolase [Natronosalvus halobius]|uniref:HAD-IIA family hydrolase n=1 Tax=Natronosalvus halobius TaxID=2953746 RepID=UPI00209CD1D1|nr:HAD-IIA family hydrolase [Natronosalvus halobius]USZ72113.1 HAD-IIA family hydrolase [Natronosalvus halobius]